MSGNRKTYASNINLISTTTPESHITYCNDHFCQVAGYEKQSLLDQPHNMIRHQDMPKAAFKQMWSYIQNGNSWMGLVKNQCKDSQHYWVSAFVTPIHNAQGEIHEYQSVRHLPNDDQIARADTLYKGLQKNVSPRQWRMSWLKVAGALLLIQSLLLLGMTIGSDSLLSTFIGLQALVTIGIGVGLVFYHQRHQTLVEQARQAYHNPLMEQPYTGYFDDHSAIELALMMKKAELRAVAARASETTDQILRSAEEEQANCESTQHNLAKQSDDTQTIAAATEELSSSINDVATNAESAAEKASQTHDTATRGLEVMHSTESAIGHLSENLDQSQHIIEQLLQETQTIDGILEIITGIAEQTNLLALNAAIEAARAGNAGRGFAVVADEVRNLSEKTRLSVTDIQTMISNLQATTTQATEIMQKGQTLSETCRTNATQSAQSFEEIVTNMAQITERSGQISVAMLQQSAVTQEIAENLHGVKATTDNTVELSEISVNNTEHLVQRLQSLSRLIHQFEQ
ncbi:methyl-accepting chemotaxis protein [Thaumasiovibrio subtropicus]|uniref:methyl-accepting chemotaxis protein n=1 Tax=Thaumasiovibrio subtropicus TaxID=1891207 RepID=UPI000B36418F|nr:PAS domain-containing methyl-accepting chemotaxis protein [Thaumasiovibrio subtropicus]